MEVEWVVWAPGILELEFGVRVDASIGRRLKGLARHGYHPKEYIRTHYALAARDTLEHL